MPEAETPLSRSLLWKAQRAYFHRRGVDAWRSGAVPHYITGNPALARASARVVLGFLRDRGAEGGGEPLHIVEIGAGTGRFGFLFLEALSDILGRSSLKDVAFRYVMTDFTEANLGFFREHGALRPFVERGVLDFARFDAEDDASIRLERAGATLGPGSLRGPLVVLANYVFDGLPQDAFRVEGGRLHEGLVAPSPEIDPASDDPFNGLTLDLVHRPAAIDPYPEPGLNETLRARASALGAGDFLFPCAAIRCVDRLAALSGGRLLLLSADRWAREPRSPGDLGLDIHGCFSLPVDLGAMAAHFRLRFGRALCTRHRPNFVDVVAFVSGGGPGGHPETELAYEESVSRAGPDDFFALRRLVDSYATRLEPEHILALFRMGQNDPKILRDHLPALSGHLDRAEIRRELREAVDRALYNHYPLGEERDFAVEIDPMLPALRG